MRKLLVLTGTLLVAAALGLGGWWAWPILFPSLPSGWLSTLAKADAALVQNRPDLARKALGEPPEKLPVAGWLQWEKRVNAVAAATGAWLWARTAAEAAHRQFPGNADLAAYLVWTDLKAGAKADAAALAEKVLPGTPWTGLLTQARVEAAGLASGDWSGLRETLAEPGAGAFEAYDKLSTLSDDPELRQNALLAALSRGDLEGARRHLGVLSPEQRDRPPFDRLQALMAYDQGDWTRAAALLKSLPKNRPENLMVLADVFLHLGDPAQAEVIYDQLLADRPDDVPAALAVNRATLALDAGDPKQALQVLDRFVRLNPSAEASRVRLLVLEARFRLGETDAVQKDLVSLTGTREETDLTIEAELLKGRLYSDLQSVPRLWSLLHRHPSSAPLAERLAWLLVAGQDYGGARRVLDLYEASRGDAVPGSDWWAALLRALILGAENRLEDADAAFAAVPAAWRSGALYADWGLTALVRSQQTAPEDRKAWLDRALERYTRALELAPPSRDREALVRRSSWLTRRGETQTSLLPLELPARRGALRSAAAEDYRQAVDLDPENLRASFLLRQTEAALKEKP